MVTVPQPPLTSSGTHSAETLGTYIIPSGEKRKSGKYKKFDDSYWYFRRFSLSRFVWIFFLNIMSMTQIDSIVFFKWKLCEDVRLLPRSLVLSTFDVIKIWLSSVSQTWGMVWRFKGVFFHGNSLWFGSFCMPWNIHLDAINSHFKIGLRKNQCWNDQPKKKQARKLKMNFSHAEVLSFTMTSIIDIVVGKFPNKSNCSAHQKIDSRSILYTQYYA